MTVRRVENGLELELLTKDRWMKGPDQNMVARRASGGRLSLRVRGGESLVRSSRKSWSAENHAAWGGDERMIGSLIESE